MPTLKERWISLRRRISSCSRCWNGSTTTDVFSSIITSFCGSKSEPSWNAICCSILSKSKSIYFEGTLDKFKAENPTLFKKDGGLKADYVKANEIIARIERDGYFMKYMSGEKQVIMTGTIGGAEWKIKIDSYMDNSDVRLLFLCCACNVKWQEFSSVLSHNFLINSSLDVIAPIPHKVQAEREFF